MADQVFGGLLVHEAEVRRPRVELDQDGVPKTPVFEPLVPCVACRLVPARAVSDDDLLGRTQDASHVLYVEPMDLRVADQAVLRPTRTALSEDAMAESHELEVLDSSGLLAGLEIEVGSSGSAETNMIAEVAGTTIVLRDGLGAEHEAGEAVSVLRHYEVLAVQDECGIGHHLRAVVKELA